MTSIVHFLCLLDFYLRFRYRIVYLQSGMPLLLCPRIRQHPEDISAAVVFLDIMDAQILVLTKTDPALKFRVEEKSLVGFPF